MGHPRFAKRRWQGPKHPWRSERITEENLLIQNYGLRNHREIWKARSKLRRWRQNAMKLIGRVDASEGHFAREKQVLIDSLQRNGLLGEGAQIDDVLRLSVDHVLARRLQSQVYFKGLASSMSQARQLLVHNHIAIGDQVMTVPSYIISRAEEEALDYHPSSPLSDSSHSLRKEIEELRAAASYEEEPETPTGPESPEEDDVAVIAAAVAAAPSAEDTIPGGDA